MAKLSDTSKAVLKYLQEHDGENLTAQNVTDALGLDNKRKVDGAFTSFTKEGKEWGYREEVAVEGGKIKYLRLTDAGRAVDPDNPPDTSKEKEG